jgi:hypothetical protein
MQKMYPSSARAAVVCSLALVAAAAQAATFRILFNGSNSAGQEPTAVVQMTPNTFFWDATGSGILSVTKSKQTAVLYAPTGGGVTGPVTASNGRSYTGAGAGTGYLVSYTTQPNTAITYPRQAIGAVLRANLPSGALLGFGNDSGGYENLITADLQGSVTSVYKFSAGEISETPPFYGSDGNYYGVSLRQYGPGQGASYVYRITPAGSLTDLVDLPPGSFTDLNWVPSLFQARDGNLYGDTLTGGNGYGTFYRVTLAGQYTLLYTFPSKSRNSFPGDMFQASDGNFYGIANGCCSTGPSSVGTIFMLTPSMQYTALETINGDKGLCWCRLIQGSDGNLYGTAVDGGLGGIGTMFELELGLPVPAPQARTFQPASGAKGTQVMIWGYNLLEASVSFNGVPAKGVHSSGPNYVWATVPPGAASGPIAVTTAGGTSTTTASFTVR